jgi:hypothetical protein
MNESQSLHFSSRGTLHVLPHGLHQRVAALRHLELALELTDKVFQQLVLQPALLLPLSLAGLEQTHKVDDLPQGLLSCVSVVESVDLLVKLDPFL